MDYIDYAKSELKHLGYKPIEECEDGPNKWIQENLLEILEKVSAQGHSGHSIHYLVNMLKKLILFRPLSPLTGDDSEWSEIDSGCYQNNRLSCVFKENGVAYTINGYDFWDWSEIDLEEDEIGFPGKRRYPSHFTSRMSRKRIDFPYEFEESKSIKVENFEVNKDTGERQTGSGWWEIIYPQDIVDANAALELLLKKES